MSIRVLHILQRMEAGGTQTLLMNLYRNIDRDKVQFDFLVEYPERYFYDDEIESLGGQVFYSTVRKDFNLRRFKKRMDDVLRAYPYKVVHTHTATIGWFAVPMLKHHGVPVRIAHSHNSGCVFDAKYFPKLALRKIYPICATDLFACSTEAGHYSFGNRPFTVLKNAIDAEKFRADSAVREEVRKELGLADSFVVGHVGRFHPQKNHKFLIRIFDEIRKKRPESKLLLIGSGPLERDIRRQIDSLGLAERAIFLGNRNDMPRIYQAMDVFLLPSLFEGLGIVAIESQAAGVPAVCSDKVSMEIEISPMVKRIPLSSGELSWADACLEIANHPMRHQDIRQAVINSGFDIRSNAEWIEGFYCQKANQSGLENLT